LEGRRSIRKEKRKEESEEGRRKVSTHKQTIYIVPKSTHELRHITALEPV